MTTQCDAVLETAQQERKTYLDGRQADLKERAEKTLAKMGLKPVPPVEVMVRESYGDTVGYVARTTFCGVNLSLHEGKETVWQFRDSANPYGHAVHDLGDLAPALERAKERRERMEKRHAFFRRLLGRQPK